MNKPNSPKRTSTLWTLIALGLVAMPFIVGAQECGSIWAETDSGEYDEGEAGIATLFNELYKTAYLPGCATFNYERLVDGTWRDMGPNRVCVWEGYIQPLRRGANLRANFSFGDEGTWRLRYLVAFGCTEGEPMSQADCDSTRMVYTPAFQVTPPTCDEVEAMCEEMDGVFNPETCTCCRPGAHQVQECEMGRGSTFDYLACQCRCVYNSDCDFGMECEGGECLESECHEGNPPGEETLVAAKECPEGYMCVFGDGVDLNHGNGWCEFDD